MKKRILFVCHGNICRSPMAEFVMKWLVDEAGRSDEFYIESAATSTEEIGNPVYPPARRKLGEHGISCAGKTARQMTRSDYSRFDLIIGMDDWNIRNMLRILGSDPEGKVQKLMAYAGHPEREVADPWYTGDFEATWQDVLAGCQGLLNKYAAPEMPAVEQHPLKPFLPDGARLLMLGSFPPAKKRWSMDFFYPNFQNDMWRIFGLIFFGDKNHFVDLPNKRFRREAIIRFLTERGIALYDTACAVRRLKNTASDKDLEVVTETDIDALLRQMPQCEAIVTTGQKATDVLTQHFQLEQPPVGGFVDFTFEGRRLRLYRMPSSSRAYPLALEKKAEHYAMLFTKQQIQL